VTSTLALARRYGVAVRFADLGDWGNVKLRSEYDATIPEIRINLRYANAISRNEVARFVDLAVGHELYHHREAIGEVRMLPTRRARETAANRFGQALLERGD
jgi:hypothetical protein